MTDRATVEIFDEAEEAQDKHGESLEIQGENRYEKAEHDVEPLALRDVFVEDSTSR